MSIKDKKEAILLSIDQDRIKRLRAEWKTEFEAWDLPCLPVSLIASGDYSGSYEMDRVHIFLLENGEYAYISEQGCSCYESSEALVDLYNNKHDPIKRLGAHKREREGR